MNKAKKLFAERGADTDAAIKRLAEIPVSVHCWQGDDVLGFDGGGIASGGIQTTGNYPGRARTPEELMQDIRFAFSLMAGKKRLNLHASYAILGEEQGKTDRDAYRPEHFAPWVRFAKEIGLAGDRFQSDLFFASDGQERADPLQPRRRDAEIWIRHCRACLKIAEYFADEFGSYCLVNIWIPDGLKDVPADRLTPRLRLKESLDEILALPYDRKKVRVAVESKVFGIGVESYTVGSNEFYQNYAATRGICCLLDNGHYHPTETVSDKIPSLLAFYDNVALHVTRGVRWDSDHVVLLEDELKEICKEIVRGGAEEKVMIGLDYFDASINRIAAWVVGERNVQKALLFALLQPHDALRAMQDGAEFTAQMVLQEEMKTLPYGDVWEEYLKRYGYAGSDWFRSVCEYEEKVLKERR